MRTVGVYLALIGTVATTLYGINHQPKKVVSTQWAVEKNVHTLPLPPQRPMIEAYGLALEPQFAPDIELPMPRSRPEITIEVQEALKPSLLDKVKLYMGKNPTGWASLWCARFMAMVAPQAAKKVPNPNWARDWLALRHIKPSIGAIVVLTRGRGGHIGVVSGFDKHGNPTVVSGNHGHKVAESTYPKRRVLAYVSPD